MRNPTMLFALIPVVILAVGTLVWLQPEWVIARLRRISPDVLYAVETMEPVIALTIDDGPDSQTTPLILDLLKQYGVHATFFLISERVPGNEALVQRMIAEGHEIGNHMTADESSIRLSIEEFEQKMLQAEDVLSAFDDDISWFRPGSGWYSDDMLDVIKQNGYRCALGSVYPYDPQLGSAWFSTNYIRWKVSPGDVIVLHDYQERGGRTLIALENLLPELQLRGYKFVTLTDLTGLEDQSVR
jgi:peptidoglycan/xylan/chitin deacetylase (PgdA/CDA1 family)